jgi:hypothetical protein
MILGSIITFILILIALIALFWNIFGIPLGIVLVILKRNKKVTLSSKQILVITFGGLVVLGAAFILFFIFSVVLGFLGGPSTSTLTLPPVESSNTTLNK